MFELGFRRRRPFAEANGAPGRIRTPNLLIRSQVLYPVELRARDAGRMSAGNMPYDKGERLRIETSVTRST